MLAAGLDAHDAHLLVLEEGAEDADGIGAAAHAGDHRIWESAGAVGEGGVTELPGGLVQHLRPGLVADHRLQVPNDVGEGMRANCAADDVVSAANVGHPVSQGLVHCILQGAAATLHGHHRGAQLAHSEAIQLLPLGVNLAHIDYTLQVQQRASRSGGYAMLPCTRLRNDPLLAQLNRQQRLTDGVVDLVGARVSQLFTLEPNLGSAAEVGEALGVVNGRGAPDELFPQTRQLRLEDWVYLPLGPSLFQLMVRHHECLGNEAAAKNAVTKVPLVRMLLLRLQVGGGPLALRRRLYLPRHAAQRTAAELLHQLARRLDATPAQLLDDLGAYHAAICKGAKLLHMLPLGDPEADHHWEVIAELLGVCSDGVHHALALLEALGFRQLFFALPGASDSQQGHHIHHARKGINGRLRHLRKTFCAAGGRSQRHKAEIVLGRFWRHDPPGLLHRQIHHDEAVNSRFGTLLAGLCNASCQEGVVVAHQQQRHLQALSTRFPSKSDHIRIDRAILDGDDAGSLDGATICHGVREGDAELNDVRTLLLELQHSRHGISLRGIARRHKGDHGGALGLLACCKAFRQSGGHCQN
mmetsp:Transcript_98813/g.235543  ORF Transcript_98813/g.235543 Transcript_98813/m.235543 type:complete len:583 (-) Transcript_98813:72-1820(-)